MEIREVEESAGLEETESNLLDLVDNLLNRGVCLTGEVVLGLAGVDLVYLRLSLLLCAADKLWSAGDPSAGRRSPSGSGGA